MSREAALSQGMDVFWEANMQYVAETCPIRMGVEKGRLQYLFALEIADIIDLLISPLRLLHFVL